MSDPLDMSDPFDMPDPLDMPDPFDMPDPLDMPDPFDMPDFDDFVAFAPEHMPLPLVAACAGSAAASPAMATAEPRVSAARLMVLRSGIGYSSF
ncbi:hypothetical protein FE249_15345 [Acidiphilium multivorum]|uniref:hypothetical protein n=1 Tax=Acidiphilium multivorum TaxID=62140 RepID=UPI001F4C0AD3|nr:hypothetical protein [Acidiphilium multivorum]UNC15490.1 hypothetical protein FE249_15345 [Acidiphilium multivorum]